MRRRTIILLCISILASLWLPVNGDNLCLLTSPVLKTPTTTSPTLPDKTITQPKLPSPDSLPALQDPISEPLTFTAPTDLVLIKAEKNLVSIQWKDNSGAETKYVVERKELNGDYAQLAVLDKDAVSYNDTSVEPGNTYYYRIKAGKDSLDPMLKRIKTSYTAYSNELEVSTPSSSGLTIKDPSKDILCSGGITKTYLEFDTLMNIFNK